MGMDPVKRIANYEAKLSGARTSGIVTRRLPSMSGNFGATASSLVAVETQVRQVCNGAGVPTIAYPFYLNFGREIWALKRRGIAGESLAIEAAVLIAKWVAQGLTEAVLGAIRTDVFNVSAPIGP